jgi:hypothetical protein
MRWFVLGVMAVFMNGAAAQGIEAVLERSQQARLARRPPAAAQAEAVQRVRDSLTRLLASTLADAPPVELVLVGGDLFAEALLDRPAIAVSEAVGELPEPQRLLMLAHELGHIRLAHAQSLKAMYRAHVPAAVAQELTDPVAVPLGAEGIVLSHRNELAADAWAYVMTRPLGVGLDDAMGLLARQATRVDTLTHPGTARRIVQWREIEQRLMQEHGSGLPRRGAGLTH